VSRQVGVSISLNRPFTYNMSSSPPNPFPPIPPLLDMHRQMDISATSIRPRAPYSWDATFVQLDPGSAFRRRAPGRDSEWSYFSGIAFWLVILSTRREEKKGRWVGYNFFYLLSSVVLVAVFASSSSSTSIFILFVLVVAVTVAIRRRVRIEKRRTRRRIEPGSILSTARYRCICPQQIRREISAHRNSSLKFSPVPLSEAFSLILFFLTTPNSVSQLRTKAPT
jgi:hypothetical protein